MAWYAFWQQNGDETWELILADQRERIVREKAPAFTTILDVDNDFKTEMTAEELSKIHFRGPFYVDFDADSLEAVIPKFKQFLRQLRDDHGFDLEQGSYFASGGKGFHVVIPPACFIGKPSPKGYANLPYVYKEMAMELYVDTLDLKVYSARKGRMFRTANVERPDKPGVHKVPLTVKEALEITPELYREYVKAPRHVPAPLPPELNPNLALIFQSAFDKVDKAIKSRKKSKADENLLKKFGGDLPPSLITIMNGDGIADGVGFQKIATQLAIAAHALGKTEEQFLSLCGGLVEKHESDGTRYNTPSKRRTELSRMYQYMHGNPCYQFSIGGVKSLLSHDVETPDFDSGGVPVDEEEEQSSELDYSLTQGVRLSRHGIFKKTEEGVIKISAVGLSNPAQLYDISTNEVIGYEVDAYVDGHLKGRRIITMDAFASRAQLLKFTLSLGGCSVSGTDQQASALADILRTRASNNGNVIYTTRREGVDIVQLPDGEHDFIYADSDGVVSRRGINYKLRISKVMEGQYQSDLRRAPHLEDTPEAREFFKHLFSINTPEVLGRVMGWMFAAFHTQLLRKIFEQFPVLQVYGPAGSGKTHTVRLMARLHYYNRQPKLLTAGNMTPWATDIWASSSGSIPMIVDEYKPRQIDKRKLDKLKDTIRNNYSGATTSSRGNMTNEGGATQLNISSPENKAPLAFIGEAMEPESAIMERSLITPINKLGRKGHSGDFRFCQANGHYLSELGRLCLDFAVKATEAKVRSAVLEYMAKFEEQMGDDADNASRPIYNMAVAMLGLEFGRLAMQKVFGNDFDEDWLRLQNALIGGAATVVPKVMSEAAKVLDTLAYLSRSEIEREEFILVYGIDYVTVPEASLGAKTVPPMVEINLVSAYARYARYKRSMGEEVLYDSTDAFIAAMSSFSATMDRSSISSVLKKSFSDVIYRFNAEELKNEGVGEFNSGKE